MNAVTDLLDPVIRAELANLGLRWANCISWNAAEAVLYQQSIAREEAEVSSSGALVVSTGQHTGRSPKDKYIVHNGASAASVWWEGSQSMSVEAFEKLKADMLAHARLKSLFVQDLLGGADADYALHTRVITETAWAALFIRHLLIKPKAGAAFSPKLHVICLPSFKANPSVHGTRSDTVIAVDLKHGLVLIAGTHYAGEIKKSVFTALNHLLPDRGVLPMHCSTNIGKAGDTAIFFGLSGTGKTTLSTDPERRLIGDDEHGWSEKGVFNFEGGCYAKAINLSAESEPEIFAAANRWGTVLENVTIDPETRLPDFKDGSRTENTRAAYPLAAIANASTTGMAPHPKAIIMLTCDAFGVLPPVSKLSGDQAMFHFMSGYTAKVSGTERGVTEPQATFSACFGAPFLTRHPSVYAAMLKERMEQHQVPCYLVNTGWAGGGYGVGRRMPLALTRKIIGLVLTGGMENVEMRIDPHFGFSVPSALPGVAPAVLNPRKAWPDSAAYDAAALKLLGLFAENFKKFGNEASSLLDSGLGEGIKLAAE
jgi:phosphoenolpyruvate carboxykinase (ATP)